MKNDIKLSVIILSYKQEKYIREAIDSVLAQKVNFKYELLLADDCSQDGTLEIMKEYEKKNPEIVKVLERKENLGANNNYMEAATHTQGEYITILEGDDFWIDENKLQTQVDFLDQNSDYVGVSHLQEGRCDGNVVGNFPSWIKKDREITLKDFMNNKNYSSSSCMYRNIYKEKEHQQVLQELYSYHPIVGDLQSCFYYLTIGKIYVFAKPMMVYRILRKEGEANYNSKNSVFKITYDSMIILNKMRKLFNYKYSFRKKYSEKLAICFGCAIIDRKYSEFKLAFKACPKGYRILNLLTIPYYSIKFLLSK